MLSPFCHAPAASHHAFPLWVLTLDTASRNSLCLLFKALRNNETPILQADPARKWWVPPYKTQTTASSSEQNVFQTSQNLEIYNHGCSPECARSASRLFYEGKDSAQYKALLAISEVPHPDRSILGEFMTLYQQNPWSLRTDYPIEHLFSTKSWTNFIPGFPNRWRGRRYKTVETRPLMPLVKKHQCGILIGVWYPHGPRNYSLHWDGHSSKFSGNRTYCSRPLHELLFTINCSGQALACTAHFSSSVSEGVYKLPFGLYLRRGSPESVAKYQVEAHTLRLMEQKTRIPAPRAVDVLGTTRFSYLLMTCVSGRPIEDTINAMTDEGKWVKPLTTSKDTCPNSDVYPTQQENTKFATPREAVF